MEKQKVKIKIHPKIMMTSRCRVRVWTIATMMRTSISKAPPVVVAVIVVVAATVRVTAKMKANLIQMSGANYRMELLMEFVRTKIKSRQKETNKISSNKEGNVQDPTK